MRATEDRRRRHRHAASYFYPAYRKRATGTLLAAAMLPAMLFPTIGDACTLWGATGGAVADGGTLVAKNRDWKPVQTGETGFFRRSGGRRVFGLFSVEKGRREIRAGINEEGLAVMTATAGSIPEAERLALPAGENRATIGRLLAGYSSVREIIAERNRFSVNRPAFFLLADRERIAVVEVAPGGRAAIAETAEGILCHTNHYLDESLRDFNRRISAGSRTRLDRIRTLTALRAGSLRREDFIAFSGDRHAGPDRSLWRTGGKATSERTLASFIVRLPRSGPPQVHVRIADPGAAIREYVLCLDAEFWKAWPTGQFPSGADVERERIANPREETANAAGARSYGHPSGRPADGSRDPAGKGDRP